MTKLKTFELELGTAKMSFDHNNIIQEILKVLKEHEDQLNSINVFPIADKDTGTNLYKTLDVQIDADNFKDFIFQLSDKVLYSARGSSGNILALFLLGLKENYSEDIEIMCEKAAEFAWNTMYEPREGTMLTAMKAVPKEYDGFTDFVYQYSLNVVDCLLRGPDLLPILKERGTLDSGTLGFLYILCGIYEAITGTDITPVLSLKKAEAGVAEDEPTYCVEVLMEGVHDLRFLHTYGDELITVSCNGNTKVHIHSDKDFEIVKELEKLGRILKVKVDNMRTGQRFER